MKFYIKVFLNMIVLISISFAIFGTLMIQASFRFALDREIEMGKTENQMLSITYEATVNSLPVTYYNNRERLENIARSLQKRIKKERTSPSW